jgi:hypothetical protein
LDNMIILPRTYATVPIFAYIYAEKIKQ